MTNSNTNKKNNQPTKLNGRREPIEKHGYPCIFLKCFWRLQLFAIVQQYSHCLT